MSSDPSEKMIDPPASLEADVEKSSLPGQIAISSVNPDDFGETQLNLHTIIKGSAVKPLTKFERKAALINASVYLLAGSYVQF